MVSYSIDKKYAYFNGLKFTRDDKTSYYLNSTKRQRLHRAVWEFYKGTIPTNMQVHHKDKNLSNNEISNFELIPRIIHQKMHGESLTQEKRDWCKENINKKARPKAVEWHKSKEGREWHKKQYSEMKEALYMLRIFVCKQCGTTFMSPQINSKFCSNACKSAWRRSQKVDDEVRNCEYCGKQFKTNKYKKQVYCSGACSNRATPRLPSLRKNKID